MKEEQKRAQSRVSLCARDVAKLDKSVAEGQAKVEELTGQLEGVRAGGGPCLAAWLPAWLDVCVWGWGGGWWLLRVCWLACACLLCVMA
jgi:hypothetical protein